MEIYARSRAHKWTEKNQQNIKLLYILHLGIHIQPEETFYISPFFLCRRRAFFLALVAVSYMNESIYIVVVNFCETPRVTICINNVRTTAKETLLPEHSATEGRTVQRNKSNVSILMR